jgi:hypothetical protein
LCTTTVSAQAPSDNPHTLLWAVINAKGDTSYLFGTFHEFGTNYFRKYPVPLKKMKDADIVFLEEIPGKSNGPKPTVHKWLQYLSKEEYVLLEAYVKKAGYDKLKDFRKTSPYEVKYLLYSTLYAELTHARDSVTAVAMEEYMLSYRNWKKKKIAGLEKRAEVEKTVQFVVGEEEGNDSLVVRHMVDFLQNERQYADSMRQSPDYAEAEHYMNADINYHLVQASTDEDKGFAYALDERNAKWLPLIKQSVDTEKTFIAVGIRHLWYRKGLINLLLKEGYKVVPMAMK